MDLRFLAPVVKCQSHRNSSVTALFAYQGNAIRGILDDSSLQIIYKGWQSQKVFFAKGEYVRGTAGTALDVGTG